MRKCGRDETEAGSDDGEIKNERRRTAEVEVEGKFSTVHHCMMTQLCH